MLQKEAKSHPTPSSPSQDAASVGKGSPPFIHRHLTHVPGPWLGWKSRHIFQALGATAWHWSPQWPKEPPEQLVFRIRVPHPQTEPSTLPPQQSLPRVSREQARTEDGFWGRDSRVAWVHSAQGCLLWGGQQSPASRGLGWQQLAER